MAALKYHSLYQPDQEVAGLSAVTVRWRVALSVNPRHIVRAMYLFSALRFL
jgi:hypothetical protein